MQQVNEPGAGAGSKRAGRKRGRLLGCAAVAAAVLVYNLSVWWPASAALARDTRNEGFQIHVYRTALLHPTDITIDLVSLEQAAPIDLMRGVFQSAEALKGRKFGRVTLARSGKAVFRMEGQAFSELGQESAAGQNPLYLIRTLPEKLQGTDGQPAFGQWTGGWLGVMSGQMEDVNRFAQGWAEGRAAP